MNAEVGKRACRKERNNSNRSETTHKCDFCGGDCLFHIGLNSHKRRRNNRTARTTRMYSHDQTWSTEAIVVGHWSIKSSQSSTWSSGWGVRRVSQRPGVQNPVELYQWHEFGILVVTLPEAWRYEIITRIGWLGVYIIELVAASRVRPPFQPPVEGPFPLKLTWVLTSSRKTLLDESINRGLVCAHMHPIVRTQKILTFMS